MYDLSKRIADKLCVGASGEEAFRLRKYSISGEELGSVFHRDVIDCVDKILNESGNKNVVALVNGSVAKLDVETLDDLFAQALSFGKVRLCTHKNNKFYANIEFETKQGISLEAAHNGFLSTPHEALRAAIDNAREIMRSFK